MQNFLRKFAFGGLLLLSGMGVSLAQQGFTGKGPAGCTDKKCWMQAVSQAQQACKASGCNTCTPNATAGDNCKFEGATGYSCTSYCKAPGQPAVAAKPAAAAAPAPTAKPATATAPPPKPATAAQNSPAPLSPQDFSKCNSEGATVFNEGQTRFNSQARTPKDKQQWENKKDAFFTAQQQFTGQKYQSICDKYKYVAQSAKDFAFSVR